MVQQAEILVVFYCTVSGENDDLLGVDETPITDINWIAIDATDNTVSNCSITLSTVTLGINPVT